VKQFSVRLRHSIYWILSAKSMALVSYIAALMQAVITHQYIS